MKKAKFMKAISLSLTTIMIVSLLAVPAPQVNAAKKSKTKLSNTSITMKVGQKKTLKLKKYSKLSKKKIKKVKWSVTKKNIVELKSSGKYKQNCKVTAKKAGSTTIKLKYNGKTYKCKVVVKKNKTKSTSTEYEDSTEKKTEEKTTENKTEQSTTENKKEETTEENKSEEQTTTENGTTEDPKVEACTHNWSDFTITKNATCTVDGEKSRTCSNCGETETEKIAAGHSYGDWVVTTSATCVTSGIKAKVCSKCGNKETEEISATGVHLYNNWQVTTEATCKAEGVETRTCACGKTETRSISKLNHTETNGGLSSCHTKCSECGLTLQNGDYHQYSDNVITEATCKKTGILKHTCDCGYNYTETIPVSLEHTYNDDHQCTICGVFDEDSAYLVTDISEEDNDGIMLYAYETKVYDANGKNKITAYDVYIKSFDNNCHIAKNPYHSETSSAGAFSVTSMRGKAISLSLIHSLTFVNTVKAPKDCTHFLSDFGSDLISHDIYNLVNLDTYDTTNMYGMFDGCYDSLSHIYFNTSNVTNMKNMFRNCSNITYLSFNSSFDTSKVTNMSGMFSNLTKCEHVEVENFDTSNVTDMSDMFTYMGTECYNMPYVSADLRNWDTSKVTDMTRMFYHFGETKGYYIQFGDKFSTKSVTSISRMFDGLGKNWESNTNKYKSCSIFLGSAFLVDRSNINDSEQYSLFDDAYLNVYNSSNLSDDVKTYLQSWGTVNYYK